MAKIKVFLHGQKITELELESGHEYVAGRSSSCHIQLSSDKGISRQHLRLREENGVWIVQLVAKFGTMVTSGQATEQIILNEDLRFSVPPYEFEYTIGNKENVTHEVQDPTHAKNDNQNISSSYDQPAHQHAPNDKTEVIAQNKSAAIPADKYNYTRAQGNLEATVAGSSSLVAYIKIRNNKLKTEDILKLEGHTWTLGRHPSCEIVVNDSAISRKHFDLINNSEGYFVVDHGTSNGTKINGDKINAHEAFKILSGDVIRIKHIEVIFEIHDANIENQMALVPVQEDITQSQVNALEPSGPQNHFPAVLRIPPGSTPLQKLSKFNGVQITIAALCVVLVLGLVLPDTDNGPNKSESSSTAPSPAKTEELTPDKRKEVVDTFNLAQNYYLNGKYVLCRSQIEKLHSMVPFHSNSKELEGLCKNALELQEIDEDKRRKEEAKSEAQNKIRENVEACKIKITPSTTTDEITTCLQPAMELDPQDINVQELISQVQINENAIRDQNSKALELARKKNEGKNLFNRANSNYKAGQLRSALSDYKKFVRSGYPGLNQEEDIANRNIASISKKIDAEIAEQITKCKTALDKADLKAAILACDSVLKEHPDNKEATEIRKKAYSQLQREMKSLYEDSRIEESLGNIESAKEKWQRIIDKSIPQDDYYKKANKNLKKYGIGL